MITSPRAQHSRSTQTTALELLLPRSTDIRGKNQLVERAQEDLDVDVATDTEGTAVCITCEISTAVWSDPSVVMSRAVPRLTRR